MDFDIQNHLKHFPHSAVMEKEGRIYGILMQGNDYRRENDYHGAYPRKYIDRILSFFPGEDNILHLFSGTVRGPGVTFDCNPNLNPDFCGNAEEVDEYFAPNSFKIVLADPPYTAADAEKYGTKMPQARIVMQKLWKIVEPGGIVVWLSTKRPICRTNSKKYKEVWFLRGLVGFDTGSNKVIRGVYFWEKPL